MDLKDRRPLKVTQATFQATFFFCSALTLFEVFAFKGNGRRVPGGNVAKVPKGQIDPQTSSTVAPV